MAIRHVRLGGQNTVPGLLHIVEYKGYDPDFRLFAAILRGLLAMKGRGRRPEQSKDNRSSDPEMESSEPSAARCPFHWRSECT